MFDLSGTDDVMEIAVEKTSERSEEEFSTAADDRSTTTGSFKTDTKQDRRRFLDFSPNSRQSRYPDNAESLTLSLAMRSSKQSHKFRFNEFTNFITHTAITVEGGFFTGSFFREFWRIVKAHMDDSCFR